MNNPKPVRQATRKVNHAQGSNSLYKDSGEYRFGVMPSSLRWIVKIDAKNTTTERTWVDSRRGNIQVAQIWKDNSES